MTLETIFLEHFEDFFLEISMFIFLKRSLIINEITPMLHIKYFLINYIYGALIVIVNI